MVVELAQAVVETVVVMVAVVVTGWVVVQHWEGRLAVLAAGGATTSVTMALPAAVKLAVGFLKALFAVVTALAGVVESSPVAMLVWELIKVPWLPQRMLVVVLMAEVVWVVMALTPLDPLVLLSGVVVAVVVVEKEQMEAVVDVIAFLLALFAAVPAVVVVVVVEEEEVTALEVEVVVLLGSAGYLSVQFAVTVARVLAVAVAPLGSR